VAGLRSANQFEWDAENVAHLARHRISPGEAEACLAGDPLIATHDVVDGEDRWTAVGATSALRILVLVFTVRNERIRPITGWDAAKRTKLDYFERNK